MSFTIPTIVTFVALLSLNGVHESSASPPPDGAPETFISQVHVGMTCKEAKQVILGLRKHIPSSWADGSGGHIMRLQIGDGTYVVLRYRVSDRVGEGDSEGTEIVTSVKIVKFAELIRELDQDLQADLKAIHGSPSLQSGFTYDPVAMVRTVNYFAARGKKRAVAALRKYLAMSDLESVLADSFEAIEQRNTEYGLDDERVVLIARLLFVLPDQSIPRLPADFFGMSLHIETFPSNERLRRDWPLFPVVIVNDIPLKISVGYASAGAIGSPAQVLDFCEQHCVLRPPLQPTVSPLAGLETLVKSARWRSLFAGVGMDEEDFIIHLLRNQVAYATRNTMKESLIDADNEGEFISDAAWSQIVEYLSKHQLLWNPRMQQFQIVRS